MGGAGGRVQEHIGMNVEMGLGLMGGGDGEEVRGRKRMRDGEKTFERLEGNPLGLGLRETTREEVGGGTRAIGGGAGSANGSGATSGLELPSAVEVGQWESPGRTNSLTRSQSEPGHRRLQPVKDLLQNLKERGESKLPEGKLPRPNLLGSPKSGGMQSQSRLPDFHAPSPSGSSLSSHARLMGTGSPHKKGRTIRDPPLTQTDHQTPAMTSTKFPGSKLLSASNEPLRGISALRQSLTQSLAPNSILRLDMRRGTFRAPAKKLSEIQTTAEATANKIPGRESESTGSSHAQSRLRSAVKTESPLEASSIMDTHPPDQSRGPVDSSKPIKSSSTAGPLWRNHGDLLSPSELKSQIPPSSRLQRAGSIGGDRNSRSHLSLTTSQLQRPEVFGVEATGASPFSAPLSVSNPLDGLAQRRKSLPSISDTLTRDRKKELEIVVETLPPLSRLTQSEEGS